MYVERRRSCDCLQDDSVLKIGCVASPCLLSPLWSTENLVSENPF